ncbi:MAG: substrate-binding domain-containing protein [Paracoccaceae bacterium]|nr:substrate-binding domain-containing protein [Paracoccaceae bacterium]
MVPAGRLGGGATAPKRRVTINDLADDLGLAKGTVSRALNGHPDIAETTRLRVCRRAEAMGYRPLSQAQGIRTGRTRSIGLVLRTDLPNSQRPFLSDFLAGVTRRASAEHWTLTVATAASEEELLDIHRRLVEERKADGFILPRTDVNDTRIEALRALGTPFVLFGRTGDAAGCAWFDIAGETAMRQAVAELHRLGHRRIAYVGGAARYNFAKLREDGFRSGLAHVGFDDPPELRDRRAMTHAEGRAATLWLLDLDLPPTAIVFATDLAALGAYAAARDRGIHIGRELSVISYDGIPEGAYAEPGLTTYEADSLHAGDRLAALLIRRIRGEAAEDLRELAPAKLVRRGSDGPPLLTPANLADRLRSAA